MRHPICKRFLPKNIKSTWPKLKSQIEKYKMTLYTCTGTSTWPSKMTLGSLTSPYQSSCKLLAYSDGFFIFLYINPQSINYIFTQAYSRGGGRR
jgi:hypothetical protein